MTRHPVVRVTALALLAALCALVALNVGAAKISVLHALSDAGSLDRAVLEARASRVALGALCGGALAASGTAFQALLRNPLGDPFALGVSGGAALAATVAVLAGASVALTPFAAFVGAGLSALTVLALARASGSRADARSMLLAGLVLNTASSALLAFLRSVTPGARAQETLSLLLGAVSEERPRTVALVAAYALAGVFSLGMLGKSMNALTLGEESAASLGVNVRRTEIVLFLAASLTVGGVVSVCGLVPFVGLVVPHYARAAVGADHRAVVPASFFGGAALLMIADAAARWTFHLFATEAPVGALTALVGAPFLFFVLRRTKVIA